MTADYCIRCSTVGLINRTISVAVNLDTWFILFVYFMFYFVFQNKIHILRNVVDSCDKHQTGLLIIILITNVRQYLRRRRPDIDSVQGASCRPTHGPLYTSASI